MNKIAIFISVLVLAVSGMIFIGSNKNSVGSVVDAGTYSFVNLTSTNASSTAPTLVRSGVGTLGSVVVATTHATIVRVYDGTATSTGTLIASFPASATVGTYTFDIGVKQGIAIDIPAGFAGNYTVTYR